MDKYIKILLIQLSKKYKITVTHIMGYNDEQEKLYNIFKLNISNKTTKKIIHSADFNGKRELISELMKWQTN